MSIFVYFILIFIIIRVVSYFIKQGKEQNQNSSANSNKWKDSYSQRLRSVLMTCEQFEEDEIIDSAVGFYLFSYDSSAKEFIFIEEDDTIHRISYHHLIEFKIRESKDYRITIDLKTSFPNKPYISIICFDTEKVLKKMPQLQYRLPEVDILYELERDKADEIEDILLGIIEENQARHQTEIFTPPPYTEKKEEKIIIEEVADHKPVNTTDTSAIIEKTTEAPIVEEPAEIVSEIEEPISQPEPIDTGRVIPEPAATIADEIETEDIVTADGKTRISLSEIEDYSRGKFLEYEVQSAVSDAKMRGDKFIYLTSEQIERLKS